MSSKTALLADLGKQVPLIEFDEPEPPTPTSAGELEDQEAGRRENQKQEAPTTPDETEPAAPPTLREPALPSPMQPAQPPPAANSSQAHPPSLIPPSSSATLAAEIHKLASRILCQAADSAIIRDLQVAAGGNLELLRSVLEEMDMKRERYDAADSVWFVNDVAQRCQYRRSEWERKAGLE